MDLSTQFGLTGPLLGPEEFEQFRRFIFNEAGIEMMPNKRALIQSRLASRLRALKCASYASYWHILQSADAHQEREQAINLLSTNETYFFREPQQFAWLQQRVQAIAQHRQAPIRIWSAACSTGEKPYTIAITLAETLGTNGPWYIYATDINTRVTRYAKRAIYPIERAQKTPPHLWRKYFQHGEQEYTGKIRVKPGLARQVVFENLNLLHSETARQSNFDVIVLRNVLIYFNEETKHRVLKQLCTKLADGGHLLIGHAEVIRQKSLPLVQEVPSRYRYVPECANNEVTP